MNEQPREPIGLPKCNLLSLASDEVAPLEEALSWEVSREMREPMQSDPLPPVSPEVAALEWVAGYHAALSHITFRQEAVHRARAVLGWDVPSVGVAGHPTPIPITQAMMDLAYATFRETGLLSDVLKALVPLVAVEIRKIGEGLL